MDIEKIKNTLKINKKADFDWCYKILSSLTDSCEDDFTGITESDETFFGQRITKGKNSTHNRVKKWLDGVFWGVATKYLQNYMNWFMVKEQLKNSRNMLRDFVPKTMESNTAMEKYNGTGTRYEMLIL